MQNPSSHACITRPMVICLLLYLLQFTNSFMASVPTPLHVQVSVCSVLLPRHHHQVTQNPPPPQTPHTVTRDGRSITTSREVNYEIPPHSKQWNYEAESTNFIRHDWLREKMGVFGAGWKYGQIWSSVKTAHAGVAMTKSVEVKEEMEWQWHNLVVWFLYVCLRSVGKKCISEIKWRRYAS